MHLPNGAVSPTCVVLSFGIAAAGTGLVWLVERKLRPDPEPQCEHGWRAFFAVCALVLGLQALQVPAPSGRFAVHLLGGVLAAWQLGALRGVGAMATVLAVQALGFGDGAVDAYGLHVFAMGVVPALCLRLVGRSPLRVGLAAGLSVLLAVAVLGLAVRTAHSVAWSELLRCHLPLVFLEAGFSAVLVAFLTRRWMLRLPATAAVVAALGLAATTGNALPDGLTVVLQPGETSSSEVSIPLAALCAVAGLWLLAARVRQRVGDPR
jgi:ABC-type Co2+ transport system permease subunit